MSLDLGIGAVIAAFLLIFFLIALLAPEKF
ncbi:MAG: potassium-transporting ATPase subunit F [Hyphomonadaceae bacterium]|nr:MAG: K+-transporting ATPase ATPase A chain [Caulobacteraceae bacterium]MBT9445786.1 potassium-transporting ATPase subunit F [Hyphomonadaceae bacterium]